MKTNTPFKIMAPGDLFRIGNTKPLYRAECPQNGCLDCAGYRHDRLCRRLPFCCPSNMDDNVIFKKLSPRDNQRAIRKGDEIFTY
jgi:hypothetical protein